MNLEIIILAAGKGTRMNSAFPKVLQPLCGRPLLEFVLDTSATLDPARTHVVFGYGGEQVQQRFAGRPLNWVSQVEQKGTGHAVAQALPAVDKQSVVLVLYGDVPLISQTSLEPLLAIAAQNKLAILTMTLDEPSALGRIIRDADNRVAAIREFKDADESERAIHEINTGVLSVKAGHLSNWLSRINDDNAQNELYLTDIVGLAVEDGVDVVAVQAGDEMEILGVNDKAELAALERMYQQRQASALMRQGLTLADPQRVDIRGTLEIGRDCALDINTLVEGECSLGNNVSIGAHCILRNASIGDDTVIEPYSLIEDSLIGQGCQIGPYARLRPGSELKSGVRIGNFVEVKNSVIGENSKANHLSYVGDSLVGENVNMGAGLITCNYDGANKHQTIIGNNVHIGSDCQLVAPVIVNDNATIGAGTTVFRDAPAGELTLNSKDQVVLPGWQRPEKQKG